MKKPKVKLKFPPLKIMIPLLVVVVLAAAVCIFLWVRGGSDEEVNSGDETEIVEEVPAPTVPTDAYTVGTETLPVLTIPEVTSSVAEQEEGSETVAYVFSSFPTPVVTAETYMRQLMDESVGFIIVDDDFYKYEAPDFTKTEGSVRLAKEAGDGLISSVVISWTAEDCTVELESVPGVISDIPEGMTLNEAFEYIKSLPPSALGLSGESMNEYQVYTESGTVLVGNRACMQISVHSRDNPQNTNKVSSYYLLSSDGRHIYRLDKATGEIEELDI